MLPVVIRTARLVAVHNERVAADLREQFPDTPIEAVRLGTPAIEASTSRRTAIRAALGYDEETIVFAAFGKVTSEKRIGAILRALAALAGRGVNAQLLLVGDASDYRTLNDEIVAHCIADRVRVTGFVGRDALAGYLAAADVCLCLRWPTARETSASWLQCLSASKPTIISDLAHTVDIPGDVTIRIDLLDEDEALRTAMHRLATNATLRADLARAGRAYWSANHTMEAMANDYRRIIGQAAARPNPAPPADLPSHFRDDHSRVAREIMNRFGLGLDVCASHEMQPRKHEDTKNS
jgi:glycosyltransferase involved in cell wall biosynthesis